MEQDLIEKKPSSPLLTSLLAIIATCLLCSIVLQGMEIAELKHEGKEVDKSASAYAKQKFAAYDKDASTIGLRGEKKE